MSKIHFKIKEKIKASIFLQSYFETLGFKNGSWEFNFRNNPRSIESSAYYWTKIMHEFFSLGGFSKINIKDWKSSDDTIMAIASGKACLKSINSEESIEKFYIDEYIKIEDLLKEDIRYSGNNTLETLAFIKRLQKINKLKYNVKAGGNGAAMRTSMIGLIYYKETDLEKLIENSIIASRVTHNYTLGFLGGLVTALFTSFAIRDIPIWEWSENLLKIYENNYIDNYMKTTNIYKEYMEDKYAFFDNWYQYNEQKVSKFRNKSSDFSDYDKRIESLNEYNKLDKGYLQYGASGLSCVILAYDSMLMSFTSEQYPFNLKDTKSLHFSLDSLLFFSALHFGDNDTTGAVAGAWYGAMFGFTDFDIEKINQLEFKNDLDSISKKIINLLNY